MPKLLSCRFEANDALQPIESSKLCLSNLYTPVLKYTHFDVFITKPKPVVRAISSDAFIASYAIPFQLPKPQLNASTTSVW